MREPDTDKTFRIPDWSGPQSLEPVYHYMFGLLMEHFQTGFQGRIKRNNHFYEKGFRLVSYD